MDGMAYRIVHTIPPMHQLMCVRCGEWLVVSQKKFELYYAFEKHKQAKLNWEQPTIIIERDDDELD
ncbi:unnamed protein product [marine sediment metagenome]|uniref:Uncharacterized protein n=1 Tax=marine sediment metagenome TaxID=412755 RepID=X0YJC9_9ZZZZ